MTATLLSRIADTLSGPKTSKEEHTALLAETVEALREAETRLAQHETAMVEAGQKANALTLQLDGEAGSALQGGAAAKKYDATQTELEAVKSKLAILERAARAASKDLAELRLAQRRLTDADRIKAISRICGQRAEAAEKCLAAAAEYQKQRRALYDVTDRLRIAYGILPAGACASRSAIFRAEETEMYRISGTPFQGAGVARGVPSLPGAKCHDARLAGMPNKLPSIVDAITSGNDVLIRELNGEAVRTETVLAGNAGEVGEIDDDGLGPVVPAPTVAPKTHTALEHQTTIKKVRMSAA